MTSTMPEFPHQNTSSTAQYYTEPLDSLGNALHLQMVLVPGGTFLMGSPDGEPEEEPNEKPQHEVTVPQFFMGRYPIQAQWKAVMGRYPITQAQWKAVPYSSLSYPGFRVCCSSPKSS
jgi:formylglycine-generating enzyme required for sulfatase activity